MAFSYPLEDEDGTPADPPTLRTAVSECSPGDTSPRGRDQAQSVTEVREVDERDGDPVLVGGQRARPKRPLAGDLLRCASSGPEGVAAPRRPVRRRP